MQLGYTFLNVWLLWVNTYSTFKTLDRRKVGAQGTRSSKLMQRTKREMKTCLSTWVAWVAWNVLERIVDATVGIFIPFLHEIKCLCLIFLIITRPWGTEPLVLNVLRPAIRPYLGIIDTTFHWLEIVGDLVWLLVCMPYHMFMDWWYPGSKKEDLEAADIPELTIGKFELDDELEPQEVEEQPKQATKPSTTTLAAIEAHRKEQQLQAEEETKLKEVQARSARDRTAHLQRVAGAGPPLPVIPNNAATSKTVQAVTQNQNKSSDDLPASTLRLPRGVIPVKTNEPNRIYVPVPRRSPNPNPQPTITKKPSLTTDSSSTDENNRRAVLAMPVPTRPRPQRAVKPAVYSNASASIARPANPAPPSQVPSVVVPLASQTLPRHQRVIPIPGMQPQPQSQSLRTRSSQTLRSDGSTGTIRSGITTAVVTPNVSEFGTVGTIRRGSADTYVSGNRHRRETAEGTSATLDGDNSGGQPVRWEDFMASLERQGQTLAAPFPRGTGDDLQADGRILNNREAQRQRALPAATNNPTRGTEEMVRHITDMQKEVDEKLRRIAQKSHQVDRNGNPIISGVQGSHGIYPTLPPAQATGTGRGKGVVNLGAWNKPIEDDSDAMMDETETLASSVSHQHHAGKKRPRKYSATAPSSEEYSSDGAENGVQRSPKKRRKDLDEDIEMNNAEASTIASTVKSRPVTRASRQQLTAKDKSPPIPASAPPGVTRSGTIRTTRNSSQKPAEPAVPSVATRTRGRRPVVS